MKRHMKKLNETLLYSDVINKGLLGLITLLNKCCDQEGDLASAAKHLADLVTNDGYRNELPPPFNTPTGYIEYLSVNHMTDLRQLFLHAQKELYEREFTRQKTDSKKTLRPRI